MDWLPSLAAILGGFVLRLAVPVAITAVIVWLLRRLDARWQREAEERQAVEREAWSVERGEDVAPRSTLQAPRHCWEVRDCPPEVRDSCPAYAHPEMPCWQVFRNGGGRLKEECLDCELFRDAPVPLTV